VARAVISSPMDFGTMAAKLDGGEYRYVFAFESDLQLIFDNCRRYNEATSIYAAAATTLDQWRSTVFQRLREHGLLLQMSSHEGSDIEEEEEEEEEEEDSDTGAELNTYGGYDRDNGGGMGGDDDDDDDDDDDGGGGGGGGGGDDDRVAGDVESESSYSRAYSPSVAGHSAWQVGATHRPAGLAASRRAG
jgi:hypothetical protein